MVINNDGPILVKIKGETLTQNETRSHKVDIYITFSRGQLGVYAGKQYATVTTTTTATAGATTATAVTTK